MRLVDRLRGSALHFPDSVALDSQDGVLTYSELDALADSAAAALHALGVRPGDRVGIWLAKSAASVAAMQGVLRLGAAYVPIDPLGPLTRTIRIARNCEMAVVVCAPVHAPLLREAGWVVLTTGELPVPWLVDGPLPAIPDRGADDLAYILYTSGSTGVPKGVCISERNAEAFIDWAVDRIEATPKDRFSNHAPMHFDLSVLDMYGAFTAGAALCLVPEYIANSPSHLVDFVVNKRISVWYSVPSALVMMMEHGGLLDRSTPDLRVVLFAGEAFPPRPLCQLIDSRPNLRFENWYGPTETNVCTAFRVDGSNWDGRSPVPIGFACSGNEVWVGDKRTAKLEVGKAGELIVSGPTVMMGYWGKGNQVGPLRTGDRVVLAPDGALRYLGRRDHMVKIRGHRVQLGEVDTALLALDGLTEAAAIAHGSGTSTRLVGFIACSGAAPSLLRMKAHMANLVPRSMIVDELRVVPALPRTRNGKVDRRALSALVHTNNGGTR